MRTYHQHIQEQRYQIYALKKTGHADAEIAEVFVVHKSTVSREWRGNRGGEAIVPHKHKGWLWSEGQKQFLELALKRGQGGAVAATRLEPGTDLGQIEKRTENPD